MSVKFERETVRTNVPEPRMRGPEMRSRASDMRSRGPIHELAHDAGEVLTKGGGEHGYLAVLFPTTFPIRISVDLRLTRITGLSQAITIESMANKDADIWYPGRASGNTGFLDRKRSK